jgi:hypothetical protein
MSTPFVPSSLQTSQPAVTRSLPILKRYLALTFVRGPKQLLTSRISVKCAAIVVAMCSPSLLLCAMLTLPAMIFQSPHQNAYFQFAQVLEHDPARWFVLVLAGVCAIMSLAIPATMPEPSETSLY